MSKPLLTDELWNRIEAFLPKLKRKPKEGRPRVPDRNALTGILFVLRTGCPWEYLPKEMGCGSGMTCWRLLRDWHKLGVWKKVWLAFLDELGLADEIDWDNVALDSCSVRALFGGYRPVKIPQIAGKTAPNGMSFAREAGFRWRSNIRQRTSMIPSGQSR